jgi:hypothetical protein
MACHLPALQPAWSFVAPAALTHISPDTATAPARLPPPVQGWSLGADGRPRMRWTVGVRAQPDI